MFEAYENIRLWSDLVLATIVMIAYLISFQALGGKDLISEMPRYTWWNAWSFQVILFPLFFFLSIQEIPGDTLVDKLMEPWPKDQPREEVWYYSRCWMYIFFGYMVKDMVGIYKIGAVYVVHHLVCIFLITSFLFLDLPPFMMIAGGTFAEIGSASINSYEMGYAFGYNILRILYALSMTVSNIAVLWLLIPLNQNIPGLFTTILTVIISCLCVERTRQVLISVSAKERRVPAGKGKPARIEKGLPEGASPYITLIGAPSAFFIVRYLAAMQQTQV
jgi:hypothetical protein